ncbi:hypothetical protein [Sporisorium scitamineum]|uniref:Uncharacterized protein n=1 Tax=Sporisorium scitamineum TaxID=49012 RepID=A0A0F7RWY3_9BASI|nr:hypothetical protein [Sporisorium scitamineum]
MFWCKLVNKIHNDTLSIYNLLRLAHPSWTQHNKCKRRHWQ